MADLAAARRAVVAPAAAAAVAGLAQVRGQARCHANCAEVQGRRAVHVCHCSSCFLRLSCLVPVPLIDRARARACAPGTGRSRSCSVFPSSQRWTPSRAFQLNTRYSATKCGVDGSTQSLDCTYSHIQRLAWQTKKMAHSLRQVAGNAVLSRRVMVASRSTWTTLKALCQRCSNTLPFHNELAELCLQLLAMPRDQPVVEVDSPPPAAAAAAPVQVSWKDFSPPPTHRVK